MSHSRTVTKIFEELRGGSDKLIETSIEAGQLLKEQKSCEHMIGQTVKAYEESEQLTQFCAEADQWIEQAQRYHEHQRTDAAVGVRLLQHQTLHLEEVAESINRLAEEQELMTLQVGYQTTCSIHVTSHGAAVGSS